MGEQIKYYRRYHGYDYSKGASLFVTMATEPRRALFGRVENATVILSDLGRLVLESMESIPRFNPGIRLFEHVLMPDHLHMNLRIEAGLDQPLQVLGDAITRYIRYNPLKYELMYNQPEYMHIREPLDWERNSLPGAWRYDDGKTSFDWSEVRSDNY